MLSDDRLILRHAVQRIERSLQGQFYLTDPSVAQAASDEGRPTTLSEKVTEKPGGTAVMSGNSVRSAQPRMDGGASMCYSPDHEEASGHWDRSMFPIRVNLR